MRLFKPFYLAFDLGIFFLYSVVAFLRYKAYSQTDAAKTLVGIVLPVQQSVFTARGHHAVRLVRAFGDKVVDERSDISVRAAQYHRIFALEL